MATEATREVNPMDIANESTGAVVPRDSGAVDNLRHNVPTGITGAVGVEDIQFPRLKLVYGVGKLAELFNPGDLVLGDQFLLTEKGKRPLGIVVAGVFVFWKEYQTQAMWQASIRPRVYQTEQEVLQNGGTTAWINGQAPTFSKAAEMRLLIEKPDDITCGLFSTEIDGKFYAPSRWAVDKTLYKTAAMPVITAAAGALSKRGLMAGRFDVVTEVRKSKVNPANMTPVAVVRLVGYNSKEFIDEATKYIAAPVPANLDSIDMD